MLRNQRRIIFKGALSILLSLFSLTMFSTSVRAQENYKITHDDSLALENVFVEKYYVADSSDYADTSGGILPKGSITYRIFIDMKPGYTMQMVYGDKRHELIIKTTTTFFNNTYCNAITGFNIQPKLINKNTVALDSWITMGAATRIHTGIPRSEDKDGSIITRPSLSKADGFTNGIMQLFKAMNLDLDFFKDKKDASIFSTTNGGWAALGGGGVKGPTPDNKVLIAQLTTNGTLSFRLNVQIGTPTRGWVKFVYTNPGPGEVEFKSLAL
jgi:hypothetical protein